MRDYPADQNIINLDGVGTLRPYHNLYTNVNNGQQVVLVKNFPITVLNKDMAPQSNGSAYYYKNEPDEKDIYFFNTTTQKSREVEVAGRVFLVTLYDTKDLSSVEGGENYKYRFGVSEKW